MSFCSDEDGERRRWKKKKIFVSKNQKKRTKQKRKDVESPPKECKYKKQKKKHRHHHRHHHHRSKSCRRHRSSSSTKSSSSSCSPIPIQTIPIQTIPTPTIPPATTITKLLSMCGTFLWSEQSQKKSVNLLDWFQKVKLENVKHYGGGSGMEEEEKLKWLPNPAGQMVTFSCGTSGNYIITYKLSFRAQCKTFYDYAMYASCLVLDDQQVDGTGSPEQFPDTLHQHTISGTVPLQYKANQRLSFQWWGAYFDADNVLGYDEEEDKNKDKGNHYKIVPYEQENIQGLSLGSDLSSFTMQTSKSKDTEIIPKNTSVISTPFVKASILGVPEDFRETTASLFIIKI